MEMLAADLWDPLGGGPGKASVDSNPNGHAVSVREIRNVQPTEPQMVTDDFIRSHTFMLSNVGLSHADDLNEGVERSHVGLSHAECSNVDLERAHTPRGRSQSAHSDRGHNGHLRQNESAEL